MPIKPAPRLLEHLSMGQERSLEVESRVSMSWIDELSPRELEIARLIAKGYPNKTVAGVLDISPWTVAAHLRRIYVKLGVGCRTAMVCRLLGGELASLDPGDRVATFQADPPVRHSGASGRETPFLAKKNGRAQGGRRTAAAGR